MPGQPTLTKFLVPRSQLPPPPATPQPADAIIQKEVAAVVNSTPKRGVYTKWTDKEKEAIAQLVVEVGPARAVEVWNEKNVKKLNASTARSFKEALCMKRKALKRQREGKKDTEEAKCRGRPSALTPAQEDQVIEHLNNLRGEGGAVSLGIVVGT
eukprot:Sspe_Gene.62797::Locus_35505_Transcript_4_5_Confidence_0.500_Length_507::g.62797::m.62797